MWLNRWDDYLLNDIADFMNTIQNTLRKRNEYPAVRIYENDDGLLLESEIPGVNPESIHLELNDNTLTISIEKESENGSDLKLIRNEREYGKFIRNFQLPYKVNENEVQAEYKHGILKLFLPKAEEEKPKKIMIKTNS